MYDLRGICRNPLFLRVRVRVCPNLAERMVVKTPLRHADAIFSCASLACVELRVELNRMLKFGLVVIFFIVLV